MFDPVALRLVSRAPRRLSALGAALAATVVLLFACAGRSEALDCTNNALTASAVPEDLVVQGGTCTVRAGVYRFANVNIYGGGKLWFDNSPGTKIDFYAANIVVENKGALVAGVNQDGRTIHPIGDNGGYVRIFLYGKPPTGLTAKGVLCKTPTNDQQTAPCGIPDGIWNKSGQKITLDNGVTDYWYQYKPLSLDGDDPNAFFGYKVLAVSYGGTLQLFGKKGAVSPEEELKQTFKPKDSARSWRRLAGALLGGDTTLKLNVDRPDLIKANWQKGDHVVVTTTDYLANHSEELIITNIDSESGEITYETACYATGKCEKAGVQWTHNGEQFSLSRLPARLGIAKKAAEVRAAVGLLTHSILIASYGDTYLDPFYPPGDSTHPNYSFGGHVVARQGFQALQVSGVEFRQLGQGGRLGHYPVHFHMARLTPADTFVKDSSINESMTRWITVHATQGVTLARNVGYLSIGHGFYLEDAVETNNRLYSNLGIFARAAIENPQNPRNVPGLLADSNNSSSPRYGSDISQPAVFWITNGWNDFQGNMAAGAGMCGVCYWEIPAAISGPARSEEWESYAGEQAWDDAHNLPGPFTGASPLMRFDGNYCISAMTSFQTVGYTQNCPGIPGEVSPVKNPAAPPSGTSECGQGKTYPICPSDYYPRIDVGNAHQATKCPDTGKCNTGLCQESDETNCVPTVINDYTTSFNYAQYNFAAVWLRTRWHLISNSFISDVQNAGLTFISGGDYTHSSAIKGLWELALKTVFVGETQPRDKAHAYASTLSPFNSDTGLTCDNPGAQGHHCTSKSNGFTLGEFTAFADSEHMFNIYDGPATEDSNAYLDIQRYDLGTDAKQSVYKIVNGIPRAAEAANDVPKGHCYIQNAAIAWKQPNGFYYPPTFHSRNLFFNNVDIRHYVIDPIWMPGTYITNPDEAAARYCTQNSALFNNFSSVDRQTELTDDDGSLTGYADTISVNEDSFFAAPIDGIQCSSDNATPEGGTARTSPYGTPETGYVTSVVYPACAESGGSGSCDDLPWDSVCSNENCFGVPLYREYLTGSENKTQPRQPPLPEYIRMGGMNIYQRETMVVNHGHYYIDTTASEAQQNEWKAGSSKNVFKGGQSFDVFFVYATENTEQTYDIYVGKGCSPELVKLIRVNVVNAPFIVTRGAGPDGKTLSAICKKSKPSAENDDILQVTLNLAAYKGDFDSARASLCLPQTVCHLEGGHCVAQPVTSGGFAENRPFLPFLERFAGPGVEQAAFYVAPFEPLTPEERNLTCSYAGKDVDCPTGGCVGFTFTLPTTFLAEDQSLKQNLPMSGLTTCFPKDLPWNFTPVEADQGLAGECYKAPMTPDFCGTL